MILPLMIIVYFLLSLGYHYLLVCDYSRYFFYFVPFYCLPVFLTSIYPFHLSLPERFFHSELQLRFTIHPIHVRTEYLDPPFPRTSTPSRSYFRDSTKIFFFRSIYITCHFVFAPFSSLLPSSLVCRFISCLPHFGPSRYHSVRLK